jgi:hypothetical protein
MSSMKTMSGDDQGSDMMGRHGDLTSAYKASYARHSGGAIDGTQQSAAGIGVGSSDSDDSLTTSQGDGGPGDLDGDPGSNSSGYGKGIAGEFPMVQQGSAPSDSNLSAGGTTTG